MERKELDTLKQKAKAERDRDVLAAEQKYQDRLKALLVTWDLVQGNGHPVQSAESSRGRPAVEGGPATITREACVSLSSGYTLDDVEKYVAAHHPNTLTRKQISSALSKLIQQHEITIIKNRTGNSGAEYQTLKGDGPPKGD